MLTKISDQQISFPRLKVFLVRAHKAQGLSASWHPTHQIRGDSSGRMIIKFDSELNDDDIQYDGLSWPPPAVMILSTKLPYLVNNVFMDDPRYYTNTIPGQRDVHLARIADVGIQSVPA